MTLHAPVPFVRSVLLLAMLSLLAGCGSGSSVESFHPPADLSREALTAALTAWQEGQAKPDPIETMDPPVQVVDSTWAAGWKLKSFEILEELPSDGPKMFSVKLTLEGAPAPKDVTYVVVGKDPLWVWTKEEYDRSGGM